LSSLYAVCPHLLYPQSSPGSILVILGVLAGVAVVADRVYIEALRFVFPVSFAFLLLSYTPTGALYHVTIVIPPPLCAVNPSVSRLSSPCSSDYLGNTIPLHIQRYCALWHFECVLD